MFLADLWDCQATSYDEAGTISSTAGLAELGDVQRAALQPLLCLD